jgi:hypothetical protein
MKSWGTRYTEAAQEDRSAPHVGIRLRSSLRPSGQASFETSVIDLSLGGFAAWCGNPLPPGTLCWLTLPGVKPMQSEVVWWEDKFVGCAFSELLDPSTYNEVVECCREEASSRHD